MDNTPQEGTCGEGNGTAGESFAQMADDALNAFFARGTQRGDNAIPPEGEGDSLRLPPPTGGKAGTAFRAQGLQRASPLEQLTRRAGSCPHP
jgi:hypothetical protein